MDENLEGPPHRTEAGAFLSAWAISAGLSTGSVGLTLLGSLYLWGFLVQSVTMEHYEPFLLFLGYVTTVFLLCIGVGVLVGISSVMAGFWLLWPSPDE